MSFDAIWPQSQADPWLAAADIFDPPARISDADYDLALDASSSLRTFNRLAWKIVEPSTPYVSSWHIDCIADHLEAVTAGQIRRLIINIPPRAMKSLSTCVFWPAWEWISAPHVRWLFASYAQSLSLRDSVKCRRLIQSRGGADASGSLMQRIGYQGLLSLVHGPDHWRLTGDQNAKEKFENTSTGFRLATSVDGTATGEGGDRIVVDDPVSASQARSEAKRVGANQWWDETMTTRYNNALATAVIVMQRLHEEDLTGHLVEKGGWHHLCLPAEYEPKHPFVYPERVFVEEQVVEVAASGDDGGVEERVIPARILPGDPRTEPGELLEPVRLGVAKLAELGAALGSYGYAGQLLQRPAPSEGGMFKKGWWRRYPVDQLPPVWERQVASWDMRFSDSQSKASSYVVGQLWGIDGPNFYLLAQIRGKLSFTESVRAVQSLALHEPAAVTKLIEAKANGPAVIDQLKLKVAGLTPIEPEGGKEVRASAVLPYVEGGNVYLPAGEFIPAPPGYERTLVEDFIYEHSIFPNGANDDQVDGLSQFVNWWTARAGKVVKESYMPTNVEPVLRRGGLTLRGKQYIDKE